VHRDVRDDARRFAADFRRTTHERPFLAFLAVIYCVLPMIVVGLAVYSVFFARPEVAHEAKRNCQRTAALVTFIHETLGLNPAGAGPVFDALKDLEVKLKSIGPCKF
jgi:hypothetical protein